jgi:hypothetical protein
MFRMGERIQVGSLIYIVLDTEWLDRIGDGPNPRLPHNRFLTVRLSVTNSGVVTSGVPPTSVLDGRDESSPELNDANGLPEWLGSIRSVKPAETLHGRTVFDVPTGGYQLKLSDDAEPENVKIALVDLPLQLERPQVPLEDTGGK